MRSFIYDVQEEEEGHENMAIFQMVTSNFW